MPAASPISFGSPDATALWYAANLRQRFGNRRAVLLLIELAGRWVCTRVPVALTSALAVAADTQTAVTTDSPATTVAVILRMAVCLPTTFP